MATNPYEDDREKLPLCEWEGVGKDYFGYLQRYRVLGGWLYRHIGYANISMVFVPEPEVGEKNVR